MVLIFVDLCIVYIFIISQLCHFYIKLLNYITKFNFQNLRLINHLNQICTENVKYINTWLLLLLLLFIFKDIFFKEKTYPNWQI
jgi:hypothetical protein